MFDCVKKEKNVVKSHKVIFENHRNCSPSDRAVDESRVPVSRPKASSPGRKKLMLDTRK